jgi:hypothetical protein
MPLWHIAPRPNPANELRRQPNQIASLKSKTFQHWCQTRRTVGVRLIRVRSVSTACEWCAAAPKNVKMPCDDKSEERALNLIHVKDLDQPI